MDEATRWLCPQEIELDLDVPIGGRRCEAVSATVAALATS